MSESHEVRDPLRVLRDDLARETGALEQRHAERLQCRSGCHSCCVDDLSVFEVEAEAIREAHPELLREGRPHPPGLCAFLEPDPAGPENEGTCRIYDVRPYVCRTQGLPLRWLADPVEGPEQRDICPLNEAGEPLESLPEEACFTLGPYEARLATLQAARQPAASDFDEDVPLRRVALRSLFER